MCVCILCQRADIAAAPLTITASRYRVVDFTVPFMADNLAILVKKRHSTQFHIHSISDLGGQSTVKYGVLAAGATEDFFRNSRLALYRRMWAAMYREGNASRVGTIREGIERVLASSDEQPWAFVSESAAFKYVTARWRCDVEVIVDEYNPRYLSLAVPLGSNSLYRDLLSITMLEMLESGEVNMLRTKWWYPLMDCENALNDRAKRFHFPLQ